MLPHSPMIHPPDYSKDLLLYIASSATTIAMVLLQENPNGQEHVIYYASKNLIDSETQYSCVEKLAFSMFIYVQNFCHYILIRTTTVPADQNPMYYILTHQVLGGNIPVGLSSYRNLTLSFPRPLQRNTWSFQS